MHGVHGGSDVVVLKVGDVRVAGVDVGGDRGKARGFGTKVGQRRGQENSAG